jgi:hypothetical protein
MSPLSKGELGMRDMRADRDLTRGSVQCSVLA